MTPPTADIRNTTTPTARISRVRNAQGEQRKFSITYFFDQYALTARAEETSLPELRDKILTTTAKEKSRLPWLKLASFGSERTHNQSLRHNANVKALTGIELDYDGEQMSLDKAARILERAKLLSLLYTSPSNTKAKPRWRILLPTSCPRPPKLHYQLVSRVNDLFGGVMAPESYVLSQAYYFGSVRNSRDHHAAIIEGDHVDEGLDDSDVVAKNNGAVVVTLPKPNALLTADEGRLARALAFIPNDNVSWKAWYDVGLALYGGTAGSAVGFTLFDAWSQRSRKKYNAAFTAKTWRGFQRSPPNRIGAGTIFYLADQHVPEWADWLDAREPDALDRVAEFLACMA
jgi:hypothetical protein